MTSSTTLVCADDRRRRKTRRAALNGFDYVEVSDDQRQLTVYFLGKAPAWDVTPAHLRLSGGRRIRDIVVQRADVERSDRDDVDDRLTITVDRAGDASTYQLCIVALDDRGKPTSTPPKDFDPRYACVSFSFKAACPSDLDCLQPDACEPPVVEQIPIDYVAKDYTSFRRVLLDRLALVMPDWRERHVPDFGITLVELLAYVGDQLSYYQDSVATEAYIGTARQRISVRRHVRLVDYRLHEGCNARAWLVLSVSQDAELPLDDMDFVTGTDVGLSSVAQDQSTSAVTFEPVRTISSSTLQVYEDHNTILFYTWGERECCLTEGATSATLIDPGVAPDAAPPPAKIESDDVRAKAVQPLLERPPDAAYRLHLQPGDVLVFEEALGPKTGSPADADRNHRHAVRLTRAERSFDPLTRQLVVEIEWCAEDALPFSLCLASTSIAPMCKHLSDVSIAHGNVILVDHGACVNEDIGPVPPGDTRECCDTPCSQGEVERRGGRFRPTLRRSDITFAEPVPSQALPGRCTQDCDWSASSALAPREPREAMPEIRLEGFPAAPNGAPAFTAADVADPTDIAQAIAHPASDQTGAGWLRTRLAPSDVKALETWAGISPVPPLPDDLRALLRALLRSLTRDWTPRFDLLSSGPDDLHFVVEVDDDRRVHLRFGDGDCGCPPDAGESFRAYYRIGNGSVGNVGAETITEIVFRSTREDGLSLVARNPLAATGGTDPEPVELAKLRAPYLLTDHLERAITPADYATIVERDFPRRVQGAAATLEWNGVGATIIVAVDALGTSEADDCLLVCVRDHLERYRRIGHDVKVVAARQVPLLLELCVRVKPGYLRAHVKSAVLDAFSDRRLARGTLGLFHADRLKFGEGAEVSRLAATAHAIDGVESAVVTRLERLFEGDHGELAAGILPLSAIEIARLDNDPDFPEHGQLLLRIEGGR